MTASAFSTIVFAIRCLNQVGDRIGRTHVHKYLYLAEGWGALPQLHRFTLYLHGPYSRDLDGELLALRAGGFVTAEPDASGYGARYAVSDAASAAAEAQLAEAKVRMDPLREIARVLAPMGVAQLEALATSEYVRRAMPTASPEERRDHVLQLKPHLSANEIEKATERLESLRAAVGA